MEKYGQINVDDVMGALASIQIGKDRFSPREEGEYLLSILPPRLGKTQFMEKLGLHYNPGRLNNLEELGERRSVLCPRITFGTACVVDRVVDNMYNLSRATDNPRVAKAIAMTASGGRGRTRFVANVVCHDSPKRGVLTWEFKEDIALQFGTIFNRFGNFCDPTPGGKGQVLAVTFKRQGEWITPTSVQPTGDKSPIPVEKWSEHMHDLDRYIAQYAIEQDDMRRMIETSSAQHELKGDSLDAEGGKELEESLEDTSAAEMEASPQIKSLLESVGAE